MSRIIRLTAATPNFTQGGSINNSEVHVIGHAGANQVFLNRSDDFGGGNLVETGAGKDVVRSLAENGSLIRLGNGNDTYIGEGFGSFATDAADTVFGGSGADTFAFSTFKSGYDGGAGNDVFHSVGWQNRIFGGAGRDTISYEPRIDDSTQGDSGVEIDLIAQKVGTGGSRIETLSSIENAIGSGQGDLIRGNGLSNSLTGGGGLDGLEGGGGADLFIYRKASEAAVISGVAEEIVDFRHAEGDKIDLHLIDAKTGAAGNQKFAFIGSAAFTAAGQIRVTANGNTGTSFLLEGDRNGDGQADFRMVVGATQALVAADFLL